MSENTILGGPSSDGRAHGPSKGRAESGTHDRGDVPGDAASAVHRSRLYALLALGFERPGEEFEAAVAADGYTDRLVESAAALDSDIAETARAVGERLTDTEALHDQWASLFGVEEGLTVPPYQLRYIPGPLMTNVRQIADIRGFYEAFGLSVADGKNDRADHLCFLTEFVGHLCTREAYLRAETDREGVAVVVDAQRSFLEDHLGRWYWRFADEVSKHDGDGFYAALGDLLAALVEYEVERFDLDPDWVPDDPEVLEWDEDVFGDSGRGCGGCGSDTEGISLESDAMERKGRGAFAPDVDPANGGEGSPR